jgi:hypothetical protein
MWVVASILANGILVLHHFTKLRGLDLIGYGAAAGVALHALFGCAIAAAPAGRWAFIALLIALTLVECNCSSLSHLINAAVRFDHGGRSSGGADEGPGSPKLVPPSHLSNSLHEHPTLPGAPDDESRRLSDSRM